MGVTGRALGLRDRKKLQTRDTIRREAMRLIEAGGYTNTTIEQIAEASDISPSTFFRYFPTKESVLMANDLDQVTLDALAAQPSNLPTLHAFRRALEITMATVSAAEWRFERARLRLVLSVPELKAAQFDVYRRTIAKLAKTEAARIGRDPHDLEVRALIGAIAGGLMAVIDHSSDAVERMYSALDFIEAGMAVK
ncbi:acyl-CoA-like ligand-binding transcription factor [Mycobacterium deserti]|uniref:TetR family transcriptional regulator n=1 Tax=Mycobacterium deserti TaxID=2978347 RepID=A0ABT2MCG9_9MYCO|nr:TetR family transcriptional regulator [Mycobacterium deserti]MCT7658815.1 TetR family transcriptional regulator [Mycobacterium deserti]